MFYSYGLSIERASALDHSLTLVVASGEVPASTTRVNGRILPIGVTEPQVICGVADPFSGQFSTEFGGEPGYVLVTVNKFLRMAGAASARLPTPTSFHLNSKSVSAASSESASTSKRRLGSSLLIVLSTQSLLLLYARPWHVVVAAKNSTVAQSIKGIAKVAFHAIDIEVAITARALGHVVGSISTQGLQTLNKVVHATAASQLLRSALLARSGGRIYSAASNQSGLLANALGKIIGTPDSEAVSINRSRTWSFAAVSAESAHLSFGNNLFFRLFAVASSQGPRLQRGSAVLRGLLDASATSIVRVPGNIAVVVSAQASRSLKQAGLLRGAGAGQQPSSKRLVSLIRGATGAAVQAVRTVAAHFAAAAAVVSAQVAALLPQKATARALVLQGSQSGSMALSALRTLLRVLSVTSTQSPRIVRGALKQVSAAMTAAQSIARSSAKLLMAASSSAALLVSQSLFARALSVLWNESLVVLKGVSRARSVASPESAAFSLRRGAAIGNISAGQTTAVRRLVSKGLLAFSHLTIGSGRGGFKRLFASTPNTAASFRPRGVAAVVRQGQSTVSTTYYHFFIAAWASQQTSLLPPSGGPAEPPSFGPIDPADRTIFGFDWASRAYLNDTILSAVVTCVPPGLPIIPGSLFVTGTLVEVTVAPMTEPVLPTIFSLRCTATFASGRISSFSIPVPVRNL